MSASSQYELNREIVKFVRDKNLDLKSIAINRLNKYVKTISSLIENNSYDLVISGGNSGLYCTKITELIYEKKEITKPIILSIPTYRHNKNEEIETKGKMFDNTQLIQYVSERIPNDLTVNKVLFVDDEIGTGTTAKNCIELVIKAKNLVNIVDYTLVAENHFFEWRHNTKNIKLKYYAHDVVLPGYNNLLAYIVPFNTYTTIGKILDRNVNPHSYSFALITSGMVKNRGNGHPFYDTSKEQIVLDKYPGYKQDKESILIELKNLVESVLNE